jgi:hypothetical protein
MEAGFANTHHEVNRHILKVFRRSLPQNMETHLNDRPNTASTTKDSNQTTTSTKGD